jgi:mRNA interferase HigB
MISVQVMDRRCSHLISTRGRRQSNSLHFEPQLRYASIVSADCVVSNLKGNDHRLVVAIDFEKNIVRIKWIGTHRDYDKIDVKEVQHGGD